MRSPLLRLLACLVLIAFAASCYEDSGYKMAGPMAIEGTTVSGEEFNIEDYRGKVVLVDFWATWCDPCIGEIPNVKANYEKYHDEGLEIVGVSLDNNKKQVETFLAQQQIEWVNLYSDDPAANGWNHPMAKRYGVNAIPATFLLDREGNLIKANLRGSDLGAELEKILGSN